MKSPFPWFGGKSRVADIVSDRFGHVANHVEPFFGSGAVLLGRPTEPGIGDGQRSGSVWSLTSGAHFSTTQRS